MGNGGVEDDGVENENVGVDNGGVENDVFVCMLRNLSTQLKKLRTGNFETGIL